MQAIPGLRPSPQSDRRGAQRAGLLSRRAALLLVVLSLAGCGEGGGKPPPVVVSTAPARVTDAGQLARGAKIYKANCAVCHGGRAQGAANWQRPGPDGKYPAPPLDGSAHAWHHPYAQLKQTIREGTLKLGGSMPAWKGKLSEADTEAVIAWFQSTWPDPIYNAWADIDRRSRE
ncbi:MAG TPA: cytochrome c [Acidiferrobacterales bacterium]|nr:cytochrome c [Acidiferrobacterales bacterium]